MQFINKFSILCFLLFTLTACGFHLRGHSPIPPELSVLYLQTDSPYSAFSKQLKQYLIASKVNLVESAEDAPITLKVISAKSSQALTSSGANGQTNTYNLAYTVTYQLLNNNGVAIQTPQTVVSTRDYSVTSNQLLSDTNVQSSLVDQMQREAIYQMITRMRAPNTLKTIKQAQTYNYANSL